MTDDISDDDLSISGSSEDEKGKGKKDTWLSKKKRGAASGKLGRGVINKFIDKETKLLIKTMCIIIEKDSGDKKVSRRVKKDILIIAAKTIILYQDGAVTADQFNSLSVSFRRICSAIRNGFREKILEAATAERIESVIQSFAAGIKSILNPYLSKKTVAKLDNLLELIGDQKFLIRASKFEEFAKIAYVVAYYLEESKK